MKLKNLLFIICSCCYITLIAQDNIGTKLHKIETPKLLKDQFGKPTSSAFRIHDNVKSETQQIASHWHNIAKFKAQAKVENSMMRLDSIIKINPDGSKYQRQCFTFNEQNIITQQLNSYWNAQTNSWDTAKKYNYEWDEDGYVLMQSLEAYGSGERYEFTYNDQKLGISQIYSTLSNGEWIKVTKGEYQYDDKGNMIDEMIYAWDDTEWIKATHNTATWDDQKRQTSIVSMIWNGREWIGDIKQDYTYYTTDQLSYKGMWMWLTETKEWQLVQMFFQEFNQAGQCTAQKMRFWNNDRQDWSGEYPSWGPSGGKCITYDATITYDKLGRKILQQHKECYNDSTEWFLASEMITEWKDGLENGDYESEMNAYLYNYDSKDKIWNQREYERYNAEGLQIWRLQQLQNSDGTEMNDYFEEKYRYDERGNLTYSAVWDWVDGIRTPTIEENHTYDIDNNIVESYYRSSNNGIIIISNPQKAAGYETQDDEGWVNTSHFIYKYENGHRISKMGYRWNGTAWGTNNGQSVEYDWNTPVDELITAIGYGDPYKIDFVHDYTTDGTEGWLTSTSTYYYSEQTTDIQQTKSGNIVFANNILTITGGNDIENHIYDITGKQVYQGNNSEENLNLLSQGIYLVRSIIDSKMFTLKIIIK